MEKIKPEEVKDKFDQVERGINKLIDEYSNLSKEVSEFKQKLLTKMEDE